MMTCRNLSWKLGYANPPRVLFFESKALHYHIGLVVKKKKKKNSNQFGKKIITNSKFDHVLETDVRLTHIKPRRNTDEAPIYNFLLHTLV